MLSVKLVVCGRFWATDDVLPTVVLLQSLKEEEELRMEVEEDEMYYTTEARCRQGGNKKGAEFFASLGEGGRGMHAGPMRTCR